MPNDRGSMVAATAHAPGASSGRAIGSRIGLADAAFLIPACVLVVAISWVHIVSPVNIVSYGRDVWHHMAVLNALLESPWHAKNPHIVSDIASRTYMPWYVALAIVGRWLGLDTLQVLGLSAALSVLALVAGIWLFARAYFPSRWAPALLLLVTFGSWTGWNQTGSYTLSTMVFSASYPFAIVFAAGYFAWWLALKALRPTRVPAAALGAIAVTTAFMFATHQLQAAFAIGGTLTFALFHGTHPLRRRILIIAAVAAGLPLSSFWHYYNPLAYAEIDGFYSLPFPAPFDVTDPVALARVFAISIFGVAGLYDFHRRAWRLDLLLGFAGILIGVAILYAAGSWMVLRFLPFLAVFLQIGLAAFLLDRPPHPRPGWRAWVRPSLISATGLLLALNITAAAHAYRMAHDYLSGRSDQRYPTWSRDAKGDAEAVRKIIGTGSVVIADWTTAYPIQATHMKVVSIPYFFPEVPDSTIRQAASAAFFAPETSTAQRCKILTDYAVDAIVYRGEDLSAEVQTALGVFGAAIPVRELSVIPLPGRSPICVK